MPLSTPVDREFQIRNRGYVRDKIVLANFAAGLRGLVNPATGAIFTEDEIRRALRQKSRWYVGAQAVDDFDQGEQRRALYINDQVRIERASSTWLVDYHGRLEGETYLPASGSSGLVLVRGVPFTTVKGSTTPNDPTAYIARAPNSTLYQVFTNYTIGADGTVIVSMFALSAGKSTNLTAPGTLQWSRKDPNMSNDAALSTDFQGGTDRESDAEFASRLAGIKRFRPGAGNDSNFRAWARSSNNSIEEGWVYANALYAGTTLIAVTEKRSGAIGPLGRIATDFVLGQAIAYLTPPSSAVVPGRARVLVVRVNPQYSDAIVRIDLEKGTPSGWADAVPFPQFNAATPAVTTVTTQTDFVCQCLGDGTLPQQAALATLAGVLAPSVMVWNKARTEFEKLSISSITDLGSSTFHFLLTAPPSFTIGSGDWISPSMDRRAIVSQAVADYFDALGPGEVVDQVNDVRGGRCTRFPFTDEIPFRAGAVLANSIIGALGGSTADAELASISLTVPSFPGVMRNGPNMLVPGKFAVYPI